MWKYRCRNQFLILLVAFLIGVILAIYLLATNQLLPALQTVAPEAYPYLANNRFLVCCLAGTSIAMVANVFVLLSAAGSVSPITSLILLGLMIWAPQYVILISFVALPITFCVTLYGWISLHLKIRKEMKAAGLQNDDQIVERYLQHHKLDPKYKSMGLEIKRTLFTSSLASGLGLVALFCIIFLVQNFWISLSLIFVCLLAFRYIQRIRTNCALQLSKLLVMDCNPEACISALLYMNEHGKHYRLNHRAIMAQSLIYLNEPVLAKDVLIQLPRPNFQKELVYNVLMGYIYYLLKDEAGIQQCITNIRKVKVQSNTMNMIIQTNESATLENRLRLLNGEFRECKRFFLKNLHSDISPLNQADDNYYIGLISFVQGDYSLARLYFEKVVKIGNKLYFVANAKNYLEKIEEINAPIVTRDPSEDEFLPHVYPPVEDYNEKSDVIMDNDGNENDNFF